MSTRAIIARTNGDGWEGVYHHWDGYPAGLGATLFELYNGHFVGNLEVMVSVLIDEHRAGWSTLDGNWERPIGYGGNGPQCYCHGERTEASQPLILSSDSNCGGAEFCYILDIKTQTMNILERVYSDGSSAMQFFGVDASEVAENVGWKELGVVDLDDDEPDWSKF